jgi:LacI family transcriptional regulator
MSGIERYLLGEGYFYLVASHRRSKPDLLENYLRLLEDRMVEGLILVASRLEDAPHLPTVVVSGRTPVGGVTHVVVDHDLAAWLALTHLADLGHRRIAFFKGQPESSDTEDRWRAISETAATLGLEVHSELVLQLGDRATGQVFSAEDAYLEGWSYGSRLVEGGAEFTALFAFDDVAAIGAMRAFVEAGLTIPDDVSVVGFDDIQSAAFQNPGLTTVRQPLREMGETAARLLLQSLDREDPPDGDFVTMEPELVVRGSTGPARG